MLALDRPLGVTADLALFGDHADKDRVFYIPTRPRMARAGDGDELTLVKFRGANAAESGGVGLLSFTTELRATEAELEQARALAVDQGISEPRLVQVPWLGGKAVLAAALEEGDGLVEKLMGETTPDLAGTNRAVFSALLKEDGASLIEALLNADVPNPLGVRYELEYAGLRPALDVRIRADYKRVYDELSFGFEIGAAYEGVGVRAGMESATQKLRESGAIQVEVLHFTDDADLQARVDEAVKWFQDRLLEDFFKTRIQPPVREDLLTRAVAAATAMGAAGLEEALADEGMAERLGEQLGVSPDALGSLAQGAGGQITAASPGGSAFALKAQFTLRDVHQEELKTVTLDWTEARAERRTAAPQGLLSGMSVQPNIVEADASDDFWDRLRVRVRPLGNFENLGVRRLIVQLAYPNEDSPTEQESFTFEDGEDEPKQFAAWTDGGPLKYRVKTQTHFEDEGPWPGPAIYESPWRLSDSLDLSVHPLSDVPRVELEVSPGGAKFEETPQVQIDVRAGDLPIATTKLTADQPVAIVRRRFDAAPNGDHGVTVDLTAKPTWFLADGSRAEAEREPIEGTAYLVPAPWRSRRTVRVFPLLPEDFMEAVATLTMTEGGRSQSSVVRFSPGERAGKSVELRSLAEQAPPVRVDVLVIRGDGSTFMGAPFHTSDPVVMVSDREGALRRITLRLLAGETLAEHGLMAVQVELVDESDAPIDGVVFTESNREPSMLLWPVDPERPKVRYRTTRYSLAGKASVGEVEESSSATLLIGAVVA